MVSNRLAFTALGAACIAAAAGGGYIASRQNAVPAPAAATNAAPPASSSATAGPDRPVQETEAVVDDAARPAAPASLGTPSGPTTTAARPSTQSAPSSTKTREAARPIVAQPTRAASAPVNRPEPPSTLERPWPASAASAPSPAPAPAAAEAAPAPRPEEKAERAERAERAAQEAPRVPEPPQKTFEELVVSADSVLGLQTENRISSETARVEDRVEARVTRDVKVGDSVAIPAGSRAIGSVTLVERGGKFKERARLGIQFHTLVLADGDRLPIKTETVFRDGEAPGNSSTAKIGGGAVGGAIIGAILGGAKGAAIGATAGAGGGAAVVAKGDRNAATLPAGTPMTVRVLAPVTVTIEK